MILQYWWRYRKCWGGWSCAQALGGGPMRWLDPLFQTQWTPLHHASADLTCHQPSSTVGLVPSWYCSAGVSRFVVANMKGGPASECMPILKPPSLVGWKMAVLSSSTVDDDHREMLNWRWVMMFYLALSTVEEYCRIKSKVKEMKIRLCCEVEIAAAGFDLKAATWKE